jgi:hypothetical protein
MKACAADYALAYKREAGYALTYVKIRVTLRLAVTANHLVLASSPLRLTTTQVKVTLRLTVSQSIYLGVDPHLGLMT